MVAVSLNSKLTCYSNESSIYPSPSSTSCASMPKNERFECPLCEKICNNRDTRTRHLKKEHNHLKPCLKCPGMPPRCLLSNCRRKYGHCHDPSHDGEHPGSSIDNAPSALQISYLPNAQNVDVGPCAVCPSLPHCIMRGCHARNHCHNPEHTFGQGAIAARVTFLADRRDARTYALLTAVQTSQRKQPAAAERPAWNFAQQQDQTRAPDGDWQLEHAAAVEGFYAYHRQELEYALDRADESARLRRQRD